VGTNRNKRRRALAAEAERALPAFEIVHPPLLAHGVTPVRDVAGHLPARKADHRPPSRPARDAAPRTAAAAAHRAPTKGPPPTLLTPPAPHPHAPDACSGDAPARRRDARVTARLRKNLDRRASRSLGLGGRREKSKPGGERSDNRSRRASGSPRCSNTEETSQWVQTPTALRSSAPARNRYALLRATETGVSMPSRSAVPRHNPSRSPRCRTPAPYLPRKQNQGLHDLASEGDRGVTETKITEHLSALSLRCREIAVCAERLQLLIDGLDSIGGDL
jgi:hypothetical protein